MGSQKILHKNPIDSKEIKENLLVESILLYGILVFLIMAKPNYLPTPIVWIVPPICHVLIRKVSFEEFGITARHIKRDFVYLILGSFIILIPFYFVYRVWIGMELGLRIPSDIVRYSLFHIFYVGFPEEFFFRGYLQGVFMIWIPRGGPIFKKALSIFLSSMFFAMAHVIVGGSISRIIVFFPSILFGMMRELSGSIISSSLFHAFCNIVWRLAQF